MEKKLSVKQIISREGTGNGIMTSADSGWMTLKFTMTGDSAKNAKLGEVKLKYNRE